MKGLLLIIFFPESNSLLGEPSLRWWSNQQCRVQKNCQLDTGSTGRSCPPCPCGPSIPSETRGLIFLSIKTEQVPGTDTMLDELHYKITTVIIIRTLTCGFHERMKKRVSPFFTQQSSVFQNNNNRHRSKIIIRGFVSYCTSKAQ